MSSPGTLFNNPIIQRIRRHRTMATLYRSAVADVPASPQPSTSPVVAPKRLTIPKATLLPTGSSLPEGRVFTVAEDMRPFSPAESRPVAPPQATKPVQTQRVQRQETSSSQVPAAPERTARQPTAKPAPRPAEEQPSQDEDFGWISDQQWDALKSFMEGHQEKMAREGTGQGSAEIQLSPEEEANQEARQQAQAELARRQELARSGHLPRAKVEYVSGKKAPGESSPPAPGEGVQRLPQEQEDVQAKAQLDEASAKKGPQVPAIDRSLPPAEPVPPTPAEQRPIQEPAEFQQQVEEPPKEQQGTEDLQESEPLQPDSSLSEKPAGEEMIESLPSRPEGPEVDFIKEVPSEEAPTEVAGSTEQATSKPATIRRKPIDKPAKVKTADSQPEIEVDDQVMSDSTISTPEPPVEQESPGLGRRLLDAARSLLGREEETPESERPAGELPTSPPIEPLDPAYREGSAGADDKIVQRQPVEEDLNRTLPEVEGEESARETATFQQGKPLKEEVGTDKQTSPDISKKIPAQIQKDDRMATREAGEEGTAAEEGFQPETGPSLKSEVISRQEEASPSEKTVKMEPGSRISDDLGTHEPQESLDFTSESSATPTGTTGDETLVQTADEVQEAEIEGVELHKPTHPIGPADEKAREEGEDIPEFEVLEPADDQTLPQALPLQKAWPVQELQPPKDLPPSMTRPVEPQKPSRTAQRKPAGDDGFADEVHRATKGVSPGKPTDSSIELVTPRRPRPSRPDVSKPEQDVQRKPPESRQPVLTEREPAREPDTAPKDEKPFLVPTEIGDLPSDFWQMLGEKPPKPREMGPPSMTQVETSMTAPALQKTPETNGAPTQVAEIPSPLVTQEFPDPFVQRAVSIRDVDAVTESEPEEAESAGEPEIDVDRLAREVFPEIKRRLKVEWERGRGRI